MVYIKEFYRFIKHIINSRKMLFTLAYNGLKEEFLGSYLGIIWAVVRPGMFIFVIWVVFTFGIRYAGSTGGPPFILYLLCGMIPWFFFTDSIIKACSCIVSNEFLVKKVSFSVNILPLVSILSCLIVHLILILFLMILVVSNGFYPSIYWLQLPYYIFCSIILLLGLGWFTSAIRVFIKDVSEVVGLVVQFGFWFTPIFWSPYIISEKYRFILNINPMVYIIEGFRDTFLNKVWFWQHTSNTFLFFAMASVVLFFGAIVFKRLSPHFGDVI